MVEYSNIVFFPTISAKIIFSILNDPDTILEMFCRRHHLAIKTHSEKDLVLPFIRKTISEMVGYTIQYSQKFRAKSLFCKHTTSKILDDVGLFPYNDFIQFMRSNNLTDLPLRKLVLANADLTLYDMLKEDLKFKGHVQKEDKMIVLVFEAVNQIKCPEKLKQMILQFSVDANIQKFSTLDLKAMYLFPDWKLQIHENLIPICNQDTKILRAAVDSLFVKGKRVIRNYVWGDRKSMDIKRVVRILRHNKKGEIITKIPIDDIIVSNVNVRKFILGIEDLAKNIQLYGLQQAIIIRPLKDSNEKYEVIFGQRRFLAMKELEWKFLKVPEHAIVKEIDDATALELSFVENVTQEDMDPLEKALAIKQMLHNDGYDLELNSDSARWKRGYDEAIEKLSKRTGISVSTMNSYLKLLKLKNEKLQKQLGHSVRVIDVESLSIKDQDKLSYVIDKVDRRLTKVELKRARKNIDLPTEKLIEKLTKDKLFYIDLQVSINLHEKLKDDSLKDKISITAMVIKILEKYYRLKKSTQ